MNPYAYFDIYIYCTHVAKKSVLLLLIYCTNFFASNLILNLFISDFVGRWKF